MPAPLARRSFVISLFQIVLASCLVAANSVAAHAGWLDMVLPKPKETMQVKVLIGGEEKQIDVEVFLPDKTDQVATQYPAIILLHGVEGASRFQLAHYHNAARLNRAGFAVFYVHYFDSVPYEDLWLLNSSQKLDTTAIAERCLQDASKWRQAIAASIDAVARRGDIDRNSLAINGYSLGGFLALAATADCREQKQGPQIKAVVVNWGGKFADTKLTGDFPPTLFVHGELDDIVPLRDAQAVVTTLQQLKCTTSLHVVPSGTHTAVTPESLLVTKNFLRQQLISTAAVVQPAVEQAAP